MVLPLIPVVLIAVGAVTGSSGAALGGLGALDFKKASDRRKAALARYEDRSKKSEESVQVTNGRLKDLGEQQQNALTLVVLRMHDFLLRNERQIRESEKLLVDGVDAQSNEVTGLGRLDINATAWLGGAIGSGITSISLVAEATAERLCPSASLRELLRVVVGGEPPAERNRNSAASPPSSSSSFGMSRKNRDGRLLCSWPKM